MFGILINNSYSKYPLHRFPGLDIVYPYNRQIYKGERLSSKDLSLKWFISEERAVGLWQSVFVACPELCRRGFLFFGGV